jgi:predicted permease
MTALRLDLPLQYTKHAARQLIRHPWFSIVALLSVVAGIGTTSSVFTVFNAVLLRPLPVAEPDRLVILSPQRHGEGFVFFNPVFEALRDQQRTLSAVSAVNDQPFLPVRFDGDAVSIYVRGSLVSGSYFRMLGVAPVIGRTIVPQDDEPVGTAGISECAAVVSHDLWARRFEGSSSILGRHIDVANVVCAIVGVMPETFTGVQTGYRPDIWVPLRALTDRKALASRTSAFFSGVIGRLGPGVERWNAEAELDTLYERISATNASTGGEKSPSPGDYRLLLLPGAEGLDALRRQFSEPLWIVMGIAAVVLLIATVNVSTLLIARGRARVRELETRTALGATRWDLVIQLAIEASVLTCIGAVLGVLVAWWVSPALAGLVTIRFPPVALQVQTDIRVLVFVAGSTACTAILISLLPAISLTRRSMWSDQGGSRTVSRGKVPLDKALVVAQFALSLLLVTAAGLLLRSMVRILAIDPGFVPDRVVIAEVRENRPGPASGTFDPTTRKAQWLQSYRTLEDSLGQMPGVRSVALSWLGLFGGADLRVQLFDARRPNKQLGARLDYVSSPYFDTVGMRVVAGRSFTPADRDGMPLVAVVNQALADSPFGQGGIVSRQITLGVPELKDAPFTVVGIVADSKFNDLREVAARPMIWVPLPQAPQAITSIAVRSERGAENTVTRALSQRIAAADSRYMVRRVVTLTDRVNQTLRPERLLLGLASGFGILALMLASVGLYGSLAHAVARRTREIGVRLALGAQPGKMISMVLREAIVVTTLGLAIGLPFALTLGDALRAFLYHVQPRDGLTVASAGIVLTTIALLAAYVPARRASRVDPIVALREE